MLDILREEYKTIVSRKENPTEGSYTCYLFQKGLDKILKKCGEECSEMIIAAKNKDKNELVMEMSDLIFHMTVLMANEGICVEDLEEEYRKRNKIEGNLKTFHQVDKNT